NSFRVRSVVSMELPWADRTLMPNFPGIENAESTQDWDAGFPLTYKIRPKDEWYWKKYRGTPKAFVSLAAGQKMWGNRFGNLTAVRYSMPAEPPSASVLNKSVHGGPNAAPAEPARAGVQPGAPDVQDFRAATERNLFQNLSPADIGLNFEPVRRQALAAAEQSQDFGGLFLGFSLFLIVAALLLMALL